MHQTLQTSQSVFEFIKFESRSRLKVDSWSWFCPFRSQDKNLFGNDYMCDCDFLNRQIVIRGTAYDLISYRLICKCIFSNNNVW